MEMEKCVYPGESQKMSEFRMNKALMICTVSIDQAVEAFRHTDYWFERFGKWETESKQKEKIQGAKEVRDAW